ncbi:hypothetical protein N7456_006149 [Penicillium angulare]|uniref:RNB domain-containing protein n=1 Tax=Penicillium angulare TaxID=116970 RepID=A0A9W9FZU1_9EURO|nr:hypothetical protein N7456_006149 [Penicillium angulare]
MFASTVSHTESIRTPLPIHHASGPVTQDSSTVIETPPDQSIPAEQRAASEVEAFKDIREYLRNWQASNPNTLDPVQAPNSQLNTGDVLLGSMLNGRDSPGGTVWDTSSLSKEDDLDTSEEFLGDHLEPGDMVAQLTTDGTFAFAIYVRSIQRQRQFYTSRGNWRICRNREIDYVIKGFAPSELLDPIIPYFPTRRPEVNPEIQDVAEGGLPRPLGAPLLDMMANFEEHILEFYRIHSAKLDQVHEEVSDESEFRRCTIEEMAIQVLELEESELNSVNLFAIHQAVRRNPFVIEKDSSDLFSSTYLIQPKRIAAVVEQVTNWVHEHQEYLTRFAMGKLHQGYLDQKAATTTGRTTQKFPEHPMQQFIAKAQRLIRLSRKVRSPTIMASVGPSSQSFQPGQDDKAMVFREVLTEKFNENDQKILEYLQLYAIPAVIMPSGTLKSTASHIMRATGMYNTLGLSESSTRLFLQELGVIAPWENLSLLDQNLMLPGHGVSLMEDMRWEEVEESCEKLSDTMVDSMKHLRKDWGDLPVYCIDDADAQEIDDAVSLEHIPGSDDQFWVHIHVANPTAFLNRDDPIVEYAASRLATTYAPERTYPIFPKRLTQGNFSLAPGRPVITFSAKMTVDGEILSTEVKNGIVHNVISLTHGRLRKHFNPDLTTSSQTLTVGGKLIEDSSSKDKELRETLTSQDKETFDTLRKLMLGFRNKRKENGAMDMQPLSPNVSLSIQAGTAPLKPYEMQVTEGRYYLGDPIIQLRMQDFNPHEVRDESKNYLVSMLMNLAGHIAGQFCATRNIPVIYDGTWYDPEYGRVTQENLTQFGGQAFFQLAMPKALSASEPVHHHMLGLDAYVKSTSPLRRFTDVIAHYQIEAALRFEAEHGRMIDAASDIPDSEEIQEQEPQTEPLAEEISNSDSDSESASASLLSLSPLPYQKYDIDTHILYSQPLQTRLRAVSRFSTQHWACMLLFRAFYFAECALPASFPVLLRTPHILPAREGIVYAGVITNLGVACTVTVPEGCPGKDRMDIFGVVNAKITGVDMATLEVKMEALELVKEYERVGEWA